VNEPLTQYQLHKHLNNGGFLRLGNCELSLQISDDGTYVIETADGETYACTSIGDAAVKMITMQGEIVEKQG
jgi:hypothetical protein